MTCNPIRATPRNSLLGDQTKTRRFEHPIVKRAGFVDDIMAGHLCHPAIENDSGAILSVGKRLVVRANEKLTGFLELERAIYEFAVDLIS